MGMGVVHESQMPTFTPRFTDPISAHIPLKMKEKIWAGEYIDLYVLLKSVRELATDSQLSGDLSIKGGQLRVIQPKIARPFIEHNTHEYHKGRCPYMYVGNRQYYLCSI
jgi:hypothetical protein